MKCSINLLVLATVLLFSSAFCNHEYHNHHRDDINENYEEFHHEINITKSNALKNSSGNFTALQQDIYIPFPTRKDIKIPDITEGKFPDISNNNKEKRPIKLKLGRAVFAIPAAIISCICCCFKCCCCQKKDHKRNVNRQDTRGSQNVTQYPQVFLQPLQLQQIQQFPLNQCPPPYIEPPAQQMQKFHTRPYKEASSVYTIPSKHIAEPPPDYD